MININDNLSGFSENAMKVIKMKSSRIAASHFTHFLKDPYNKETNPNGYISLSIAENMLSIDVLRKKLENPPFSQSVLQYSELGGCLKLRESICKLYSTKILKSPPSIPILPEQIVVGAGCSPLVENLFQIFCNPGEYAIIPSPMYSSFEYDASIRFGVKIAKAPMEVYDNPDGSRNIKEFRIQISTLDRIYEEHGNKIKMILLCNPNNPTGHIIQREELLQVLNWAREKSIHVISDEIYALSIFNNQVKSQFESLYDIVNGNLGSHIHILSGFSKDFCLNGLRCGYVISQNVNLINYLSMTAPFYLCSNQVQYGISSMIEDEDYLTRYLETNQKNLRDAYEFASSQLKKYEIPFFPSNCGLFLIVDLRKCLKTNSIEGEIGIWDQLFDNHKVILNTGNNCKFTDSGYFRLIFTSPKDTVEEAIKRISNFYHSHKQ